MAAPLAAAAKIRIAGLDAVRYKLSDTALSAKHVQDLQQIEKDINRGRYDQLGLGEIIQEITDLDTVVSESESEESETDSLVLNKKRKNREPPQLESRAEIKKLRFTGEAPLSPTFSQVIIIPRHASWDESHFVNTFLA